MLKSKISIQQIPSPPLPSSPGSAATHSKYTGKRIKTEFDFYTCSRVDCVVLLLVNIWAVSAAQERPSPQHLYALLSCPRGLVSLAGPTIVWALQHRASTGLW